MEETITVRNEGGAPLTILEIGTPSAPFTISGGSCKGGDVLGAEGGFCTIVVRFAPEAQGITSSSFTISSDDPDESSVTVHLSGQGIMLLINPGEGTVGTEVEIRGAGFGSSKGKVLIGGMPIKISDWTETEIRGTLNKVLPPDVPSDVTVQPKVPKGAKIVESEALTARGSKITSVEPGSGVSGATNPIMIHGRFFSTKKGKVTLEGEVLQNLARF